MTTRTPEELEAAVVALRNLIADWYVLEPVTEEQHRWVHRALTCVAVVDDMLEGGGQP